MVYNVDDVIERMIKNYAAENGRYVNVNNEDIDKIDELATDAGFGTEKVVGDNPVVFTKMRFINL